MSFLWFITLCSSDRCRHAGQIMCYESEELVEWMQMNLCSDEDAANCSWHK